MSSGLADGATRTDAPDRELGQRRAGLVLLFLVLPAALALWRLARPPEVEITWDHLGADGASGWVRNVTHEPLRGLSLRVRSRSPSPAGEATAREAVADFPTLRGLRPDQRPLTPGEAVPFTISLERVGRLSYPVAVEVTAGRDGARVRGFRQELAEN